MDRNIWLSASHIAGVENTEANFISRHKNSDLEWKLDTAVFDKIIETYGQCDIDLFASIHNLQFRPYVSYTPDINAEAIDALSILWRNKMCNIFCPFSQIGSALQKISTDETEAIVIAPIWPIQHWFPQLLQMVCKQRYILPNIPNLLTLPNEPQRNHPLKKMRLGAFRVSGNPLKVEAYQKTLKPFYCLHGENPLKNNIGHTRVNQRIRRLLS